MTDYVPLTWENEAPSASPVKYEIVGDSEGEISASATITLVTSVTAGTPVNATNMNHIELGIEAAQDTANEAVADAAAAAVDAAAAAALAGTLSAARIPIFGYAAVSGVAIDYPGGQAVVTGLTVTLNLPATCTILAFASGYLSTSDTAFRVFLQPYIDGTSGLLTLAGFHADSDEKPFSLIFRKTGVAAGSRTIDVRGETDVNGKTASVSANLLVVAFQE